MQKYEKGKIIKNLKEEEIEILEDLGNKVKIKCIKTNIIKVLSKSIIRKKTFSIKTKQKRKIIFS